MKLKYLLPIAIATTALALSTGANADTTSVIDFGFKGTPGTNPPTGIIWNRVVNTDSPSGEAISIPNVLNTTGTPTGISLVGTSGTADLFFPASPIPGAMWIPSGNNAYVPTNPVINSWITPASGYQYQATYGDIWQNMINSSSGGNLPQDATLTLSGLAANTKYAITLLSARADGTNTGSGTYGLLYHGSSTGVSMILGPGNPLGDTHTATTVTGIAVGSVTGDPGAREITWTFITDAAPADAMLNLSGFWNVNALMISPTAVPEPSTFVLAALFGVGMLFFFRRRRIA